MPAEKRKAETQTPAEDDEEKKRRKKEEAKAFFAKKKEESEAKKKERQEAQARGEAPPEKPPPLQDIPNLAPQVRAFVTAARDASVSGDSLHALFERVISVRQEIAAAAKEVASRDDATVQMKRKAMLKVVADRLRCVEDQTLPLSIISADPAVTVLKKGLTTSMVKFVNSCGESLQLVEQANDKGNSIQYIKLEGEGPKGTGGPQGIDGSIGAQLLLTQVLETLKSLGGTSTVTKLASSPSVQEKARGSNTGKFSKFLSNYPDLLEVSPGADGKDMSVKLKDMSGVGAAAGGKVKKAPVAAIKGDPKEHLVEVVSKYLKANGGHASFSDLGQDAGVRAATVGVVAKLSKFLTQFPAKFSITKEGEKEVMTCTLLD